MSRCILCLYIYIKNFVLGRGLKKSHEHSKEEVSWRKHLGQLAPLCRHDIWIEIDFSEFFQVRKIRSWHSEDGSQLAPRSVHVPTSPTLRYHAPARSRSLADFQISVRVRNTWSGGGLKKTRNMLIIGERGQKMKTVTRLASCTWKFWNGGPGVEKTWNMLIGRRRVGSFSSGMFLVRHWEQQKTRGR